MSAREVLLDRTATWNGRAIGVDVRLVVTNADLLTDAVRILADELAALDLACSRFRPDSEIARIDGAQGRPVQISALLTEVVAVALDAASTTDGDLDPTLGRIISAIGYDRDFAAVPADDPAPPVVVRHRADWTSVALDAGDRTIRVPAGVQLDVGATAKAWAADRSAALIQQAIDGSVLVSLGGDIAMAGPSPVDGWAIRVQEQPDAMVHKGFGDLIPAAAQTVAVHVGGLATSTTTVRRWRRGGDLMYHLLDPRTGLPALSPWRTVSVAAPSCLAANVASTTALLRGREGEKYLRDSRFAARLVNHQADVVVLNGWPQS